MNLFSKEYRAILGASVFALLSVGGSGAFLWQAYHTSGMAELKKVSAEFNRLAEADRPPTKESKEQLNELVAASKKSYEKVNSALEAMTIPLALEKPDASKALQSTAPHPLAPPKTIKPEDFQTALLAKKEVFVAKAAKNRILIPVPAPVSASGPPATFSMDFDDFISKRPPEDKAPVMYRQLTAADRLLNTLLDSKPLRLIRFKIDRTEEPKETKTETGAKKAGQPQPLKPVLSALGFDLKFTATPDSLRDFLNTLTRDKHAFFVVRRIKVITQSKDSKEGMPMVAPFRVSPPIPAEPAAPGAPQASALAEYILGEEHVEVDLRVDLLSFLTEKSPKTDEKEGTKQP